MKVDEFDYYLPPELIAQQPSEKRENSKMMVLNRYNKTIEHSHFYEILNYLNQDDLLVINNTKVIPARIFGRKETGASIEIFLTKKINSKIWQCLLRPNKRIRPDTKIILKDSSHVKVIEKDQNDKWLIETSENFELDMERIGNMPLPPYIKRLKDNPYESQDKDRYQTVYAKTPGAVAAPTAGLHFTNNIIELLKQKGINIAEITLHVGLGTFKPVKCEYIKDHIMHEEYFSLSEKTADLINNHKSTGKRVIAIGTTSIRTLETIANLHNGKLKADSGWSSIFIYPEYEFKVIDACITNFHLPKSTLIMLVSAFAGKEFIFQAYHEAIKNKYRFYSYGDCMFIK